MSCFQNNEPGIKDIYVTDLSNLNIIKTHYGVDDLTHTVTFRLDDPPSPEYLEMLKRMRESVANSCLYFFPDNTWKNGYCTKCKCPLPECKSYKKGPK